jgi:glycosyltransferase involved in cell wall biosynthesis
MPQARVAIVTRTKNRVILLKRAIQSVLAQTYVDWVHVIVNDGGAPDDVEEILARCREAYGDRLVVVHNPVSVGMEAASNIGIRAASSEYVVIHDDDDTWQPEFLDRCVAFMVRADLPRLGYAYGGVVTHTHRIIEEIQGENVVTLRREPFNMWMTTVSLYRLAAENSFVPISFLFRRNVWEEVGGFRETLPVLGDWDFHLRVCARYEIGLIPEPLANYHHRVSILSGEYSNTVFSADNKHRIYESLYRNELLRRDLESGKPGLGFLVNIGGSFENLHRQFWPVERVLNRLKRNFLTRGLARFFPRETR